MKPNITDNEILLVRACKKNAVNMNLLKKIHARTYAVPLETVSLYDVQFSLMQIITKFDLVRNWEMFILEIKKQMDGRYYFQEPMSFDEAWIKQCRDTIACTAIAKFPGWRRSAFFRNRELVDLHQES